jgi:glutamate carboxypeptidase
MAVIGAQHEVLSWLDGQQEAMVSLLETLVNIDSGSYNKTGVDAVGEVLRQHLESRGIQCETVRAESYGDCIRASVGASAGGSNRHVVLMGHRDTVFPDGTAAQRPFKIDGNMAYGPGVGDMKAGLVMNTFILEAFKRAGGAPMPLVGLYTSDEEITSPSSRPVIENTARGALAVFNAEPGRPTGNVVTGRKGAIFLEFEVTGRSAHAGGAHQDGRSAIEALCQMVTRLHALTDYGEGTTVNVGIIKGGQSVNSVAPWASAEVDIRIMTLPKGEEVMLEVERILGTTFVPETAARITRRGMFLPLNETPESKSLFDAYVGTAAELGMTIGGEFSGGCADSGFTSAVGAPTICSTGPVGGKAHTDEEWCRIDTLVPRAKAVAATILRLAA